MYYPVLILSANLPGTGGRADDNTIAWFVLRGNVMGVGSRDASEASGPLKLEDPVDELETDVYSNCFRADASCWLHEA